MSKTQQHLTQEYTGEDILRTLQDNLNQAHYIQKKSRGTDKKRKPLFLVLGSRHSGKSSLLHNSEIPLTQALTQAGFNSKTWITDDGIFIDLPSLLIDDANVRSAWPKLISIIRKSLHRKTIDGIIITINLAQLIQQAGTQREQYLISLQQCLQAIAANTKLAIPLYFVLTHADLTLGFTDFFGDLSEEERQQSFGVVLSNIKSYKKFQADFHHEYHKLLSRLHERLIWRLHQARKPEAHAVIKEYPIQIESLEGILSQLLHRLFSIAKLRKYFLPRGLFFVSSCQQGKPIDRLSPSISENFTLSTPEASLQAAQNRPYFIHDLLNDVILNDPIHQQKHTATLSKSLLLHRLGYAAVLMLTISSIVWFGKNFNAKITSLNLAEQAIQQYQVNDKNQNHNLEQTLTLLNALSNAHDNLDKAGFSWFSPMPFHHVQALKKQAELSYNQLLKQEFLPSLAKVIADPKTLQSKDPGQQYGALKAYLMLGEPQHRNAKYLSQWLRQYLSANSNLKLEQLDQLAKHIRHLFQQPFAMISLNAKDINEARASLNALPKPLLAYLTLKNKALIATNLNHINNIPYLYTKAGFNQVYAKQIISTCKGVLHGDWFLGKNLQSDDTTIDILEQQVRTLYLADYINWWNLYIYNNHLIASHDLEQILATVTLLANKDASLQHLLTTLAANTSPISGNSAAITTFNDKVAKRFQAINRFTTQDLQQVQGALTELQHYLQLVTQASNPHAVSFSLAKQRFVEADKVDPISKILREAEKAPTPIKEWLAGIGNNSWQIIMGNAQQYINQQWQTQVIPEYLNNITDHYPFNKHAEKEVSLNKFKHFFAENGTLESFFTQYLKPFISTEQAHWKVKALNDLSLHVNQDILKQLIRGKIIHKMFFTPRDNLQVKFSLQPISFEPIVKFMILNLNGKRILDYQGSYKISQFNWPPNLSAIAELEFDEINGKQSKVTETGPWALFKLLDKSNVQQINDTKHYQIIFDLNGNAAKYELIAEGIINPFIPGIIEQFHLPQQLTQESSTTS